MADRQKQVAALYLNRVSQVDIAEKLGYDRATISRDVKALLKQWTETAQSDIAELIARELAELDRMELEATSQLQAAKKEGKDNIIIKWSAERRNIKEMRIKLLGLDKLTAITVQKMLESEKTSDDKIIELKNAFLASRQG